MKKQAVCSLVVFFLAIGWTAAYAQQGSFTSTDSGFVFVVTGIEDVEALARSVAGVAQGSAVFDQSVLGNRVEEQNAFRRSLIENSFQDNAGILMVNQETGNLNNQANVRVLVLAEAGSLAQELSLAGVTRRVDNALVSSGGERETRITGSFGGTVGIVGANQSAGNLNQQANVLVLGIGLVLGPDAVILGDTSLGEVSSGNILTQGPTGPRSDIITDSFTGFRGISQVAQSSGDMNVTRNVLGLSLTVLDVR